jgi:metal-responsive CopG/Arc/MetJ family transcriptional regulator
MRTTLSLPDALVKDLMAVTGEKKKSRAICAAIEDFIRRNRHNQLMALSGKIHVDTGWEELEEAEIRGMAIREKTGTSH